MELPELVRVHFGWRVNPKTRFLFVSAPSHELFEIPADLDMANSEDLQYTFRQPSGPVSRGAFIVLEGLDRSGKTTQVKLLCDKLYSEGHNVRTLRFPAWIKEQISRGYTIVCDRYYYSGMVYSAAKKNPTLSLQWARSPDVGLPRPDRVLFLDLTAEEVEKRLGYGEEKYEKRELQETVREVFLGLLVRGEEESTDMVVIDAGHPVEEVASTLWKAVQTVVKEVECGSRKELGTVGTWSPTL
ncbi:putative Thymidylate kinase [Glarea lozoyensis 74030]|uniref:dTMP kinase n=1 Tax=Glarea lozoyensis (strain ATCC 74030 / MF5533) TaxID=1104152 RepID=H0EHB3_GLAL7|nr:putative Thymidylate kinase [Glarea lozoyensis 74030]